MFARSKMQEKAAGALHAPAAKTVEKVALPLFRESFAAYRASVVRRQRTIRHSLRAKCFLPRTCRVRKRIILLSRLRTRNSARLMTN